MQQAAGGLEKQMFLREVRAPQAGVAPSQGSAQHCFCHGGLVLTPPMALMTMGSSWSPSWALVSPIWKMGMRTPTS